MLELFGKGYVIDHCIAILKKEQEEKLFRIYLTDGIKAITETLTALNRGNGATLNKRFYELLEPHKEETRTSEEIKSTILKKLRGGDEDGSIRPVCEDNA